MILITGGKGFIGKHLSKFLGEESFSWDLKDGQDIFSDEILPFFKKTDCIVHLAAVSSNKMALEETERTYLVNVEGTKRLLNLAKKYKKKFIFISTAAVYKEKPSGIMSENDERFSLLPYGKSKIQAENYCFAVQKEIPITILRIFNVYGEGQNPVYAGVIQAFLDQAKKGELKINGTGSAERDFIHVSQVVKIIEKAAREKVWENKTVNVGTGKSISINSLAKIYKNNLPSLKINRYPALTGEIKKSCADISLLKGLYQEKIDWTLEKDLEKVLKPVSS